MALRVNVISGDADHAQLHNDVNTKVNTLETTIAGINKTSLGLGNIDNTSDLNKPVSTATSAAISAAVQPLLALVGDATNDSDAFVTKLKDVLDVFSTYPEGSDLLSRFTTLGTQVTTALNTANDAKTQAQAASSSSGYSDAQAQALINQALANQVVFGIPSSTINVGLSTNLWIFNWNASVKPGQEFAVQGQFPADATLHLALGDGTSHIVVPILAQETNSLLAKLPYNLLPTVYRVWVQTITERSQPVFINRAEGHFTDSPIIYNNGPLRIKGKNILLGTKTPTLRLVSQTDGTVFNAIYQGEPNSPFEAKFITPCSTTAGVVYDLYLSNGHGGSLAEVKLADTVTSGIVQPDILGIGLGWSAMIPNASLTGTGIWNIKTDSRLGVHATGDGVANDDFAFANALYNIAQAGGGTLYLPAGTYKIEPSSAQGIYANLPSKVYVMGAGSGLTRIAYGTGQYAINRFGGMGDMCGFIGLTLDCVANSATNGGPLFGGNYTVLKDVVWNLGNGQPVEYINNSTAVAMIDVILNHKVYNGFAGALSFYYSSYLTMKGCKVTSAAGTFYSPGGSKFFIRDTTFIRDLAITIDPTVTTHGMAINFVEGGIVRNSKFLLVNGPVPRKSDDTEYVNAGEVIISENGGAEIPDVDLGTTSSATSTTLTDTTKNWSTSFQRKPVVSIVAGKGAGQTRKIASRTSTTLTLNTAWSVVPDTTSVYSIYNICLKDFSIVSNNFENQQRGISLYHAAMRNVDVCNNVLNRSGGIDIEPVQDTALNKFIPSYFVDVKYNTVNSEGDTTGGGSIGCSPVKVNTSPSKGTLMTCMMVVGNTVIGGTPNRGLARDNNFPTGYQNRQVTANADGVDGGIPLILRSVFIDNQAINVDQSYWLNTGSYGTFIGRAIQIKSPTLVSDTTSPQAGHASVNTLIVDSPYITNFSAQTV